jgi:hypothetical protein
VPAAQNPADPSTCEPSLIGIVLALPSSVAISNSSTPSGVRRADRMFIEVIMEPRHADSHRAIGDAECRRCETDIAVHDWMNLVRAEYLEMPGLSLTEAQFERMWNLSPDFAERLLQELQRVCFLRRTRKGTYVRADLCSH